MWILTPNMLENAVVIESSKRNKCFSIPHRAKWKACQPELSEAWFFQLTHWGYHFGGVSAPGLVPWSTFPLDCASWAQAGPLKHSSGSTTYRVLLSKCSSCVSLHCCICVSDHLWTWSLFLSFLPAEMCL